MADFFILGNPRSGTSLFRLILNSHPSITVPPECGFALWLADRYKGEFEDTQTYNYIMDVLNTRKFETWGLDFDAIDDQIQRNQPKNYAGLCRCVYLAYARKTEKNAEIVGDKNNYYINNMDLIKKYFSGSKKIFIVRDGRDVACSYRKLSEKNIVSKYRPILKNDIAEIAMEWADSVDIMMASVKEGAIFIKYEDLLVSPEETLRYVCRHLGLDFHPLMLGYERNNDEPKEFLQWKAKTLEGLDPGRIGGFKSELSDSNINEFNAIAEKQLTWLNY
ncbi:MAG: sulfotransferase [Alcanivorax sp.]|nr:sulfotransferase [Alcanivorax sp.]